MERIIEGIREDLARRTAVAADRLAERAAAEDPAYAALLGRAELRERIHRRLGETVEGLVRGARGLPLDLAGARADGALRAERGLPLDPLLHGYRQGGRLLWQAVTEAVAAQDRAALPRLLPGAPALWDVLDRTTDAATRAYREAAQVRDDRDRELDALLDGTGTPAEAAAGAARLGLPDRGRFAVVELGPGGRAGPDGGPESGPRVLWRIRADGETGLVELGHHPLGAVRELLAPLGVRAGVSPLVEAPAELAGARRLAVLALRAAPAATPPGAVLLDERLPAALVAGQAELAGRLRLVVLGPVLALPAEDRRVLLATLGTWLTCQGSTSYAAQRLYCHRNTVSNRLRRLERLTGRSLSDPAHIVELALAHTAVLQLAPADGSAADPALGQPLGAREPR